MITYTGGMGSKKIELYASDIVRIDLVAGKRAESGVDSIDRIGSTGDVIDDRTSGFNGHGRLFAEVDLHPMVGDGIDIGNGESASIKAQRAVI
tara:strand:- start:3511 stop:3789 length:279 start_codon:yes stop_codon:yes gene_type:complete